MAFLILTDGTTTLTLDVSMTGATEKVPDRVGAATRSFSGKWRSDEQEFRSWDFAIPLLPQATYVQLRNLVKGGNPVTAKGDAVESSGGFLAIVRINSSGFADDGRDVATLGAGLTWSRTVEISVMAGVAS